MTSWQNPVFFGNNAPNLHASVKVATTVAGTLATSFANTNTIDGVVLATGDRILVKNQITSSENGLYIVQATGAPIRALDLPAGQTFAGVSVYVIEGTVNAVSIWACITIGITNIDALTFSRADVMNTLSTSRGGTSIATIPSDGVTPIGSSSTYTASSITGDTGITATLAAGSVTIAMTEPSYRGNGLTGLTSTPTTGQTLIGTGVLVDGGHYVMCTIVAGPNATIAAGSGSLNIATCSTLEFASASGALSPTANYASLQNYTPSAPTVFTLADATQAGQYKELSLSDEAVSATQVRTSRGSIMLGQPLAFDRTARIVWNNSGKTQWDSMEQSTGLTWLVDTQQTRLLEAGTSTMGNSVAVSADGSTMLVGVAASSKCYVWIRTASATWGTPTQVPNPTNPFGDDSLGTSVAISADGTIIACGSKTSSSGKGATWTYAFNGTIWKQQSRSVGASGTATDAQGTSVALNADGTTMIVGGPGSSTNAGAFWVFTKSGANFNAQGGIRTSTGLSTTAAAGTSVALSADGNTAVIGAPGNPHATGSIVIWTRVPGGSTWTQKQAITTFTGSSGSAAIGVSVASSADGNTVAFGGPADNSSAGAVWIFIRSSFSSTYAIQGTKLVGSGAGGSTAAQGTTIALSGKGDTLFVGGPGDTTAGGAFWAFVRFNALWWQPLAKSISSGGSGGAIGFGTALSTSADGRSIGVGAPADASAAGSVYIFV